MPVARIGHYDIHYLDEGSGPAVVMIHGLAGDHTAWLPQMVALRDSYRVVVFDNRGAGRSTQVDEAVGTEDLADDTIGLMEHLGIAQAHIVGRSMGGAIAQHIVLKRPEMARSLVLCASFARLDPPGRRVLTNMREVLEWRRDWRDHALHSIQNFVGWRFYNGGPERIAGIVNLIGGETRLPECYIRQNHACLEHDTLDRLSEITCPTLIMGGGQDSICSPTTTRWMAERIPKSPFGHLGGLQSFLPDGGRRQVHGPPDRLPRPTAD
jgi:3-oxoadipate enol-lactonase